jgi:Rhodopirellula transposase DDE domain
MRHKRVEEQIAIIAQKYEAMKPYLTERSRRMWAATEAQLLGYGGQKVVHEATGLSGTTIRRGLVELKTAEGERVGMERIRKAGGGRKNKGTLDTSLKGDIAQMIEASTCGDPQTPLLWTSKSTRAIARELNKEGTRVSHSLVAKLLDEMDYSLQATRKIKEGSDHPERDSQFRFIAEKSKTFQQTGQPVISVDTKKKELIGAYKNNGQEYHAKGQPPEVNVHDFMDKEKGKASPYGVYDLSKNKGWVSVGISNDTAEFAVNSIRQWWQEMGVESYPKAPALYINAHGGGSNGSRVRLWKAELQRFANEIGKEIHVSHFPPGTSKWNKIEHKMFCFISKNWRGKPLIDTRTIIQLIGNTTTTKGLTIKARLDPRIYEKARKVSDVEFQKIAIEPDPFHGEWNYKIVPQER